MKPDATLRNPDPTYLRELIGRAGLSQRKTAQRIGVSERTMRQYLQVNGKRFPAPYVVQFAMEVLAKGK